MGISKSDLDAMSVWEFIARVDGWNEAHGAPEAAPEITSDDIIAKRERLRNGG